MTNLDVRNETETVFYKYFIDKNEKDDIKSLQDDYPLTLTSSYLGNLSELPLNEEEDIIIPTDSYFNGYSTNLNNPFEQSLLKDKIFKVVYPKTFSIFSLIENDSSTDDDTLYQRKRFPIKRRRRDNQDNIRKKIKRGFLNNGLLKKMNMIIKNKGGNFFFEKFQLYFVSDISKKTNKTLINMTFEEIFTRKELYHEKELNYYSRNLKLVKSKEIQENRELKNILNKKYCELFEEYINSKEFMNDEINRLKDNKMEDSYIKRYIYLARNLMKFYKE